MPSSCPALSSAGASRAAPCPVSTSRSSNRTSGLPASGSRRRRHGFALGRAFSCSAVCSFWTLVGVRRLTPISCPVLRVALPSTRVPSLHRHYPISTVLRTPPPPRPARPVPRGLPVGNARCHQGGLPVLRLRTVQACRRQYPGGIAAALVARLLLR